MRSYQRKAILVIANRIQGDIPPLDTVAAFAIRAELPAMDVGVAIGTVRAHILEDEAGMTLRATHLLVHAAQGITG